jgi:ABC-type Fe3+ transport system substrate-binding protein
LGKQAEPAARGRHIREKVASGEYLIGNGVLKSILTLQGDGVPVKALPIGPAQIIQQIFWTFERCPHPNAARLLGAWLANDEGKETLKALGFEKIEPLAASRQGRALLEMGMKPEYARTIPESKVRSELGKRYAELMRFTTR